jgi:hypothetical protein
MPEPFRDSTLISGRLHGKTKDKNDAVMGERPWSPTESFCKSIFEPIIQFGGQSVDVEIHDKNSSLSSLSRLLLSPTGLAISKL